MDYEQDEEHGPALEKKPHAEHIVGEKKKGGLKSWHPFDQMRDDPDQFNQGTFTEI